MKNKILNKEEFLEKLNTDKNFRKKYGRKTVTKGKMVLPPCHYGFQVWTRELTDEEKDYYETDYDRGISLMFNMRSVDLGLGFPFNIASYGLLLLMIADEVLMHPLELVFNGGDVHVYENQWDGLDKQLERDSYELPTVHVRDGIWSRGSGDIILKNYKHHPPIKLPLSN